MVILWEHKLPGNTGFIDCLANNSIFIKYLLWIYIPKKPKASIPHARDRKYTLFPLPKTPIKWLHMQITLKTTYASIRLPLSALNWSRAAVNFSVTTSHRSIRSSKPFSKASRAVVVSKPRSQYPSEHSNNQHKLRGHTVRLDTDVHLRIGRVGDSVTAEFNSRAIQQVSDVLSQTRPD